MTDFPLIPRTPASKLRYILEQLGGVHAQDSAGQTRLIAAQMVLEQLAEELGAAESPTWLAEPRGHLYPVGGLKSDGSTHIYFSTGCRHGDMVLPDGRTGHEYCQGETGAVGAKTAAVCKFCAAPCQCPCHSGDRCSTCGVLVEPLGMVLHHRAVHLGLTTAQELTEDATEPECSGEEGFCDAHGYHRDAPGRPPRTWTVTTTVTAPTPEDAERWAGTLRDLQIAEHGDHMRLDITVAPVVPKTPHDALLREQFERGVAMLYGGDDAPASAAGAATPDRAARVAEATRPGSGSTTADRIRWLWQSQPSASVDADRAARFLEIVHGERRPSSLDLALIAEAYGVTVDWLLSGKARRVWTTSDNPGMSPGELARMERNLAQHSVATPGCGCGHDGMGAVWHGSGCAWKAGQR